MAEVIVVKHPLIDHSLTVLRDVKTKKADFVHHTSIVSLIVFIEATKCLRLRTKKIHTPLAAFDGKRLADSLIFVAILRAGQAMVESLDGYVPDAPVGFIGLKRDEKTAIAAKYYEHLPNISPLDKIILFDPMLATGGSKDQALTLLKKRGAKEILALSIVAAPEGVRRIQTHHPDVPIFTASIDKRLDSRKYIVPGLGDFGDRYFGTT